mmetsp:Transcript_5638/g.8005  ORF Transcript_5638/g.8005 Transcript_5638/m.8005 type:complete len:210 (+) Transcript_5638:165-794(+)
MILHAIVIGFETFINLGALEVMSMVYMALNQAHALMLVEFVIFVKMIRHFQLIMISLRVVIGFLLLHNLAVQNLAAMPIEPKRTLHLLPVLMHVMYVQITATVLTIQAGSKIMKTMNQPRIAIGSLQHPCLSMELVQHVVQSKALIQMVILLTLSRLVAALASPAKLLQLLRTTQKHYFSSFCQFCFFCCVIIMLIAVSFVFFEVLHLC